MQMIIPLQYCTGCAQASSGCRNQIDLITKVRRTSSGQYGRRATNHLHSSPHEIIHPLFRRAKHARHAISRPRLALFRAHMRNRWPFSFVRIRHHLRPGLWLSGSLALCFSGSLPLQYVRTFSSATAGLVSIMMVKLENSLQGPALGRVRGCNRVESNGKMERPGAPWSGARILFHATF